MAALFIHNGVVEVTMDFQLTEDQAFIRKTARDFAEKAAKPSAAERDHNRIWPTELVKQMG